MRRIAVTDHAVDQYRAKVLQFTGEEMTDGEISALLADVVRLGRRVKTRPGKAAEYEHDGLSVTVVLESAGPGDPDVQRRPGMANLVAQAGDSRQMDRESSRGVVGSRGTGPGENQGERKRKTYCVFFCMFWRKIKAPGN